MFLLGCAEQIELRGRSQVVADQSTISFGYQYVGASNTIQITLTNIKPSQAISLTPVPLVGPFNYLGGTFPGTGGTCVQGLQGFTSCTVVIAYLPVATVTDNDTLQIDYANRFNSGTISIPLTGIGVSPGLLDVTFGTLGVTTSGTTNTEIAQSIVSYGSHFFLAGYSNNGAKDSMLIAKYDALGTLDTTFATSGFSKIDLGGGEDRVASVAADGSGNLYLGGHSHNGTDFDMAVTKLLPSGTIDTTFNLTGIFTLAIGTGDEKATSLALDATGNILLAGYSNNGAQDTFAVTRISPLGVLDLTWNGTGIVTSAIGAVQDRIHSIAIQTDGMVVAGGYSNSGVTDDFAMARYTTGGVLDVGFNGTGTITNVVGLANSRINAIAIQTDGSIVAAGYAHNGADNDFAVIRYTPAGIVDPTFNGGAALLIPIGASDDYATSVAVDSTGNIVLAGYSWNGANNDTALARVTSAGVLDATFGVAGVRTTSIGGQESRALAIFLPAANKILTAGQAFNGADFDLSLLRYWN